MPTFAVIEGIGEGPIISRRFRQQLAAEGWRETSDETAEVIITHSGGLYLLPSQPQASRFIHIHCSQNMPMRQLIAAHNSKIRYDMAKRRYKGLIQIIRGILNLGINGWYHLNISRGLRMRKGFINSDEFCANLPDGRHVFICGLNDDLSDSKYYLQHAPEGSVFTSIKAGHDDCWREPGYYIQTIQSLIR